eukprot:8852130-Pyramimonas_sp.AAC.1
MPGVLSAGETRPPSRRMMAISSCSERLLVGLAHREVVDVCVVIWGARKGERGGSRERRNKA